MMRRLTVVLASNILVAFAGDGASRASYDASSKITREAADSLLVSGNFKPVKSKKEIPKLWWQALGLDSLSDIGGPFSSGCTGAEPHARLKLSAVSEPHAIVIFERGGIAYMTVFEIYKHEKDGIRLVYTEDVSQPRFAEIQRKLGVP